MCQIKYIGHCKGEEYIAWERQKIISSHKLCAESMPPQIPISSLINKLKKFRKMKDG